MVYFPSGSDGKESACNAGDPSSIPGSERSLEKGNGNPLQYSCLENSMDRRAWRATVHGVAKSWTRLNQLGMYWAHIVKGVKWVFKEWNSPSVRGTSMHPMLYLYGRLPVQELFWSRGLLGHPSGGISPSPPPTMLLLSLLGPAEAGSPLRLPKIIPQKYTA